MVQEIPIGELGAFAGRLREPHLELVIQAAVAGNSAAQLWRVGQPNEAPPILLWDQANNVLYLCGELSDAEQRELADLVNTTIRPRAVQLGRTYFKARALAPSAEVRLAAVFGGIALRELPTLLYMLSSARPAREVAGIQLLPIDRALLENTALPNAQHIRAEIRAMWPSEDRFYANGFGWAAAAEGQLVCWCTAEYVSAARCGIGIATVAAFERRGIATAVAGQFVRQALGRGLKPHWECRADNIGSLRVAEKLGFELIARERYWGGMF